MIFGFGVLVCVDVVPPGLQEGAHLYVRAVDLVDDRLLPRINDLLDVLLRSLPGRVHHLVPDLSFFPAAVLGPVHHLRVLDRLVWLRLQNHDRRELLRPGRDRVLGCVPVLLGCPIGVGVQDSGVVDVGQNLAHRALIETHFLTADVQLHFHA